VDILALVFRDHGHKSTLAWVGTFALLVVIFGIHIYVLRRRKREGR
jgi:hypothetical protein